MDALTAWLSPGQRKAIYAALGSIGTLLVIVGITTDSTVTGVVGLIDTILSVLALLMASYKAHRMDFTALYGVLAAVAGALKVLGIIQDGQESHILDILSAATVAAPLLLATFRTSVHTPTGEPLAEYVSRGALAPDLEAPVDEAGVIQTSLIWAIVGILLIIVLMYYILTVVIG